MKKLILIMTLIAISLSSCLKDTRYVDFADAGNFVNFPLSGLANFGSDAITANDTVVTTFGVDYATATSNPAITVTLGVDTTLIAGAEAANPGVNYLAMPASAYTFSKTVSIPAGKQFVYTTVTIYKNLLDPSKSYMLPLKIVSAPGASISANQSVHYFHVIGNDFAGTYVWDYRRYNNGTGPGLNPDGTPAIPSLGQGGPTSGGTTLGQTGLILPISPTEFEMLTGYNGTGVMYDVTFSESTSNGVTTYSNWAVTFNAANIALWTAAGISNKVPPAFTIPPPATSASPKIFELNYVSGAASPRYIDDTYHK